jgi:hypothetical protein
MSTTSLPEQLVPIGFSPEPAAVITPDEFHSVLESTLSADEPETPRATR